MRKLLVAALGVALVATSGCGMMGEYRALRGAVQEGVSTAIEDRQSFNDTKAKVVSTIPCDMSLGAAMRIEDTRKKSILIELCGGPPADKPIVFVDSVQTLQ